MSDNKSDLKASKKSGSTDKAAKRQRESRPEQKEKKPSFFSKLIQFLKGLKSEFKKIVWPTRTDVLKGTGVVIVAVAIVAVFVTIWDTILKFGVDALLQRV